MTTEIEAPIDPDIPIIDAHHHLYDRPNPIIEKVMRCKQFLIDNYTDYVADGHNVVATVVIRAATANATCSWNGRATTCTPIGNHCATTISERQPMEARAC